MFCFVNFVQGLDVEKTTEITAKDVDECNREIILHKEDEDLDKLPTLLKTNSIRQIF
jgi:hypothetical protein